MPKLLKRMDTRTGHIYDLPPGDTVEQLAKRLAQTDAHHRTVQQLTGDIVPLARKPDPSCKKCHGTGAVPRGFGSKRFKPCSCVL